VNTYEGRDWHQIRMKYLFREIDDRIGVDSTGTPLLSVSIHRGVVPRAELTDRESRADEFGSYKAVARGDIVINRMRAFQGGAGISFYDGMVSADYAVLRTEERLVPEFFHHLVRSAWFVAQMTARLRGIGSSDLGNVRTPRINVEALGEIVVSLPPVAEQHVIAAFLDAETARIDAIISSRRQLSVLTEEALANQRDRAVLGQDRPDLIPQSKLPWLRSLPSSWTVRALRHLASGENALFTDGDWVELPHITTEGNRLIQTGNIGVGQYREQGFRYVSDASFHELGCTEVRPGDVLICRLAEPVGRACLAPDLGVRLITSVDVCILRPGPDVFVPYLVEYLSSVAYLAYMDAIARGGTRDRVSRDQLGAVPVPLPPLAEQHRLAGQLAELRSQSDAAVGSLDRQIRLLEERRQALITAAVTGQIDITGVAA
jgi:type I restriction enzyme S subunit